MSAENIVDRYKKGFGQGVGAAYQPWLGPRDVPSKGVTSEKPGRKTGRSHIVFSNLERNAFLVAQWMDRVADIREQFPLWPLNETMEIAEQLGVSHPAHSDGTPILMTTDLLLTVTDAQPCYEAITVKPKSELASARVLEKLEIERRYWKSRGVRFGIVTDAELPTDLTTNLAWIDEYHLISPDIVAPAELAGLISVLFDELRSGELQSLRAICIGVDNRLGYRAGTSLSVVRHALSRKYWSVPLDRPLDPNRPFPVPERKTPVQTGG